MQPKQTISLTKLLTAVISVLLLVDSTAESYLYWKKIDINKEREIRSILCYALFSKHGILCIVCNALYFMYCIQCIVLHELYSMHCVLCIVSFALYSKNCHLMSNDIDNFNSR